MAKVVALYKDSDGNAEVGDMWHETKVFDENDSIKNIMYWAYKGKSRSAGDWRENAKTLNVTLSLAQD